MRLRKTRVVIRFLSQRKDARRILVIGPYSVLPGWKDQLDRDGQTAWLSYGTVNERAKILDETGEECGWFLYNKEAHLTLPLEKYRWDAIIIDESTIISNPTAKITKFILSLKARYRIILTGTPAPESEEQYFTQLYFINPKILDYKSFWKFRVDRFRVEGYERVMPCRDKLWLAQRLSAHCSILTRKDVSLEKEKIRQVRYIELIKSSKDRYNKIEKEALVDGEIYKFAGQRWTELRRICGGQEKIDELKYLLQTELKNDQVVIYAWYTEEIKRLSEVFYFPFIDGSVDHELREKWRMDFQMKESRVIIIQPETIKFGQNLSSADAVIFFSRPCGLLTNQQTEERTEDLFSLKKTLLIDLVVRDTVEVDILKSIQMKESRVKTIERICRAVQNRVQSR